MEDYMDWLQGVEDARSTLARNEADTFSRFIAGEISDDQLSLYRREHHIRMGLLRIMHEQLGDIVLSPEQNHT